jgi:predicted Rossmann fold flavoprotein
MKLSQEIWDVVVIGGGPAGERGRKVLLLEKNTTLGKKLLITGGGRCNVTNNKPDVRTMLAQYKNDGQFLFSAFAQYGVTEALKFFHDRHMQTKEENEGRLFPTSNKAQSVWDVLHQYMLAGGVTIKTGAVVKRITVEGKTEKQHKNIHLNDGSIIQAHACIVATGGTSHPETGSTGEGFQWLTSLGHTIVPTSMALVPVALKDDWAKTLGGLTVPDIKLTLLSDGKKQATAKGKILFTHFGISGPTVLNMSKDIGDYIQYSEVTLLLDLFPALDPGALKEKVQTLLIAESNKKLKNTLRLIMPTALVAPVLTLIGVDGETANHSVRTEERAALIKILKAIPLHVEGLLGADKAVVSSGGVALEEVNFKTMESRKVSGLYMVGDVLNINRPSGGYSLQLCWTTGFVAGEHC